jgi:hypothetical protein
VPSVENAVTPPLRNECAVRKAPGEWRRCKGHRAVEKPQPRRAYSLVGESPQTGTLRRGGGPLQALRHACAGRLRRGRFAAMQTRLVPHKLLVLLAVQGSWSQVTSGGEQRRPASVRKLISSDCWPALPRRPRVVCVEGSAAPQLPAMSSGLHRRLELRCVSGARWRVANQYHGLGKFNVQL